MKLPVLPKGEGAFSWNEERGQVEFRKVVEGKRITVRGFTVRECVTKMKQREEEVVNSKIYPDSECNEALKDDIMKWFNIYKAAGISIKENSYDREFHTINNQILKYPIANYPIKEISSDIIQLHINGLVKKGYSYSTVKKCYDTLSQYFSYKYRKEPMCNPMLEVRKPTKAAIILKTHYIA